MDDDDSLGNFKKLTLPQGGTQDTRQDKRRHCGTAALGAGKLQLQTTTWKRYPSRRGRVKGRRVVLHIRPQLCLRKSGEGFLFFSAALRENLRKYFAYHSKLHKGFAFSSILRCLRSLFTVQDYLVPIFLKHWVQNCGDIKGFIAVVVLRTFLRLYISFFSFHSLFLSLLNLVFIW